MSCDSCDIKNLIYSYAHHIDNGELQAVAELFSQGSILAGASPEDAHRIEGSEAIHQMYGAFTRLYEDDGSPHTLHLTSNVVVDVAAGADSATAKSYALVFQAVDGLSLQPIIGVRYYDQFRKVKGGWQFQERRIDTRLAGDLSHHLLQVP
jgi:hypothetical protein